MEKKFAFLVRALIVFTPLFLASCNSSIDKEQTAAILEVRYAVTLEEATTSAINIDNDNDNAIHSLKKNTKGVKEIADFIAVPDNKSPSYYILNYKSGGFSIIAGDKRIEPVLAYSEYGYFPKAGNLPDGLIDWLALNNENVQKLKKTAYVAPPQVDNLWKQLLTNEKLNSATTPAAKAAPIGGGGGTCTDVDNTVVKGPFLVSQWGQGCNFNEFCPTGTYDCGHVPTGCVATAMAQVMDFWRRPTSYNWTAMPANVGNADVAHLMSDAGISVGMAYSSAGSGAYVSDVPNALKNTFGYGSASYGGYDYSTAKSNLLGYNIPIILGGFTDYYQTGFWFWTKDHPAGDGHAWVADGIIYNSYFYCDCSCGGENFLMHMNWGWNEVWAPTNYNGWYSQNTWLVVRTDATFNFQYFREMVYNILP